MRAAGTWSKATNDRGMTSNEAVVGECLWKQMLPVNTHTSQIIVLEVSVRIEVEADQD